MNKRQLKKAIREARWHHSISDGIQDIYNAVWEYMDSTKNYSLEEVFNDYVDEETAESMAKDYIENDGLFAVKNFLGDVELGYGWYRVSPYGYLEQVDKSDIEMLIDNIEFVLKRSKRNVRS